MEKSDELFAESVKELSAISSRLEGIAAIEESFQSRLETLSSRVDDLYARQKEIITDIDLLSSAISDLEKTFASVASLQEKIGDLHRILDNLDIQGLHDGLENASDEITKATAKLTAAEKRSKEAKTKKNLGKK
ncbi:MAG: hypothetical protein SPL80_08505 [Bacilli bacterium]|nr:hypothetical protein [Bacilli bacterium]